MEKRQLGHSQVQVSEIILGCWSMGGDYFGAVEDERSIRSIRTSLELGVNTFDTAEIYGKGRTETVLGQALAGVPRDAYVLVSKVWTSHYGKDSMREACMQSLERLKTDFLDVYFLHYPPKGESIGEAVEHIMALKREGLIRAIGVSNFNADQLREACEYGEIDVIQPCYSLLWRYDDAELLPLCRERGIGVIPYSTLAQGLLTGKITKDTAFSDGRTRAALFQKGIFEQSLEVADFLKPIAERVGRTQAQVAINWLLRTPGITAPIVGGASERHARENVEATGWRLSDEDYAAIDRVSKKFCDAMPEYELFFTDKIRTPEA